MLANIEACTTWNCINSFALWLSAIGMVFISSITLWLTFKDKIVRLKVRFNTGLLPGVDPKILNRPVYTLSFTNIGARPVTATNFRWIIKSATLKKFYLFTLPHLDKDIGVLSAKFPCKLADGEEGHVFHKFELPFVIDKKEQFIFPANSLLAFWRIFTFSVEVLTTVDKNFTANIPVKVRKELWKQYCEKRTCDNDVSS